MSLAGVRCPSTACCQPGCLECLRRRSVLDPHPGNRSRALCSFHPRFTGFLAPRTNDLCRPQFGFRSPQFSACSSGVSPTPPPPHPPIRPCPHQPVGGHRGEAEHIAALLFLLLLSLTSCAWRRLTFPCGKRPNATAQLARVWAELALKAPTTAVAKSRDVVGPQAVLQRGAQALAPADSSLSPDLDPTTHYCIVLVYQGTSVSQSVPLCHRYSCHHVPPPAPRPARWLCGLAS